MYVTLHEVIIVELMFRFNDNIKNPPHYCDGYSNRQEVIWQASASPASLGFPLSSRRRVDRTNSSTSNNLSYILYKL